MKLIAIDDNTPLGALEMLTALGAGENGFGGTPVGGDPTKLAEWLDYCVHMAHAEPLSDDFLPQYNYWVMDNRDYVIGLIRMQAQLNHRLLNIGGHLGYYIAPAHRGQGHGKSALQLALKILNKKGVGRALITVEIHNLASLRMVEGVRGVLEDERKDAESGNIYQRFWVDTKIPNSEA